MRRFITGMLIVVAMGWLTSSNAAPPDYCPLYVCGQWNGFTYYYAVYRPNPAPANCNMASYFSIAASGAQKMLGTNCIMCNDPILYRKPIPVAEEKLKKQGERGAGCDTNPTQGSTDSLEITDFVKRHTKGTPPGWSASDVPSRFDKSVATTGVAVEVLSDAEVYVMGKDAPGSSNKKRYFRLLEVLVVLPSNAQNPSMPRFDSLRIGQEVEGPLPKATKFKWNGPG